MRLFRSEEHARGAGGTAGDLLTLEQISGLARAWYRRKLEPDWRRHTADEAETLFASLGLDPAFWRLR